MPTWAELSEDEKVELIAVIMGVKSSTRWELVTADGRVVYALDAVDEQNLDLYKRVMTSVANQYRLESWIVERQEIYPDYLHNMNAAMTVVEKWPHRVSIRKTAGLDSLPWWCAFYTNDSRYRVLGDGLTAAKAICHAALLAVEIVEE